MEPEMKLRRFAIILACLWWYAGCPVFGYPVLQAQTTSEVQHDTMGTVAFGSVTASYTTLLTNTASLRQVDLVNNTDAIIYISFDASTNHRVLPAYSSLTIDLAALGKHESANVSLKHDGTAPTVGTVYGAGSY